MGLHVAGRGCTSRAVDAWVRAAGSQRRGGRAPLRGSTSFAWLFHAYASWRLQYPTHLNRPSHRSTRHVSSRPSLRACRRHPRADVSGVSDVSDLPDLPDLPVTAPALERLPSARSWASHSSSAIIAVIIISHASCQRPAPLGPPPSPDSAACQGAPGATPPAVHHPPDPRCLARPGKESRITTQYHHQHHPRLSTTLASVFWIRPHLHLLVLRRLPLVHLAKMPSILLATLPDYPKSVADLCSHVVYCDQLYAYCTRPRSLGL